MSKRLLKTPSDRSLGYKVSGSGPDILLIHGMFCSGRMWEVMISALSQSYRVWAIDLLGSGYSQVDGGPVTMSEQVEAVREFLGSDIQPIAVIAHSLGATLALELAATLPETTRLILIAPVITGRLVNNMHKLFASPLVKHPLYFSRNWWGLVTRLVQLFLIPQYLQPEHHQRVKDDCLSTSWQNGVGSLNYLQQLRPTGRLGDIRQNVLLIHGRKDGVVPVSDSETAAAMILNSELMIIADCHHSPTDECPDIVHTAILRFLK